MAGCGAIGKFMAGCSNPEESDFPVLAHLEVFYFPYIPHQFANNYNSFLFIKE